MSRRNAYGFQHFSDLQDSKDIRLREPMTICRPHNLRPWAKLQSLPDRSLLAVLTDKWENLTDILFRLCVSRTGFKLRRNTYKVALIGETTYRIDIRVYSRQVPKFPAERIAGVQ